MPLFEKNYHEWAERVRPRLGRKRGLTAKSLQWLRRRFRSGLRQHGSALSRAASCAGTEVPGYLRSDSKCGGPSTRAPRSLGITAFQEGNRQPTLRSRDERRIDRPIFDLVMRLHLKRSARTGCDMAARRVRREVQLQTGLRNTDERRRPVPAMRRRILSR